MPRRSHRVGLPLGILAWAIGGRIICGHIPILATRYALSTGYAEALVGKRYAYYMGWFTTFIYFPAMTSVLAWVSARYLGVLCGFDITGGPVMVLACLFLVGSYAVNALSPILAGKFQVATTVIKLIPLLLMGIVGTIVGLANGTTIENFTTVVTTVEGGNGHALFTAVAATAFAYEGWIIATSINAELKDARRNLPIDAGTVDRVLHLLLRRGRRVAWQSRALLSDRVRGHHGAGHSVLPSGERKGLTLHVFEGGAFAPPFSLPARRVCGILAADTETRRQHGHSLSGQQHPRVHQAGGRAVHGRAGRRARTGAAGAR